MKTLIVAATFLTLAGANLPTAKSGDSGWTTAGTLLAGVAVGVAVTNPLNSQPADYPLTSSRGAPVAVYSRPVFITPLPLMNVNYDYGRGHPGRGHAHGYGR